MTQLRSFFGDGPHKREAQELYIALVSQARNPFFYTDCAVPDTLDGRFDMILLHVFLRLRDIKLRSEASPLGAAQAAHLNGASPRDARPLSPELTRLLLECLFDDMDRSLREMGVGDMGVARRVKTISKAAFGRLTAYEAAWGDETAFAQALIRNIYRGNEVDAHALGALIHYTRNYKNPSPAYKE